MITQKLREKNTRHGEENFEFFLNHLDDLMKEHQGEFVLIHNKQFIGFYETDEQAFNEGMNKYGLGLYSVQEITDRVEFIGKYDIAQVSKTTIQ